MDTVFTTPTRNELAYGDAILKACFDPLKGLFLCLLERADMTYALRAFDPLTREWANGITLPNLKVARHVYTESTQGAHHVHVMCA
jgi:hypothetical protein